MTNAKKNALKGTAILLAAAAIFSTGCTYKANQTRQQGAPVRPLQNQPQATADTRVRIANEAADKIVKLNAVKQANVLVTGRNAYVAATVDGNQGHIAQDLETQIAQQVRATDSSIQNVYVSTNPDFVNRVNKYVTDVRQGRPVTGFAEEFNQMVQRVFPNPR